MSTFHIIKVLMVVGLVALATTAEDDFPEAEGDGRTLGLLAKPLKKLSNKLGHYLIHATGDYEPYNYYPRPVYAGQGGYYGGYQPGYRPGFGSGYHRPGFFGGFRDYDY